MTDLISRDAAIAEIEEYIEKLDIVVNKAHGFNCTTCPYFRKCDRSGYLIGLPLMRDVLALLKAKKNIVHCKECKYAHMTYDGECKYCDKISMADEDGDYDYALYLPGDFYCACGERKDDA